MVVPTCSGEIVVVALLPRAKAVYHVSGVEHVYYTWVTMLMVKMPLYPERALNLQCMQSLWLGTSYLNLKQADAWVEQQNQYANR
jgi:hypothetical protein